jgi:hypothetical protein
VGFDVTLSGKVIEDGYITSSLTTPVMYFDICTTISGDTTDSFEGRLHDESADYWKVSGTIVWNSPTSPTIGYIQGANLDTTMSYMDGTIRYLRGKFSISARGGNSDGSSFIESYSSIRGSASEATSDRSQTSRKSKLQGITKPGARRVFQTKP